MHFKTVCNISVLIVCIVLFIHALLFLRIPLHLSNVSDRLEVETLLEQRYKQDTVTISFIGPVHELKDKTKYQVVKFILPDSVLDGMKEHTAMVILKEVNLKYHADSLAK